MTLLRVSVSERYLEVINRDLEPRTSDPRSSTLDPLRQHFLTKREDHRTIESLPHLISTFLA